MTRLKEGGTASLFFFHKKNFHSGYFVFLSSFIIYLFALCPTVYVGDSGLFSAASFMIGTAHPPGYPLTITLGKLFTFLPVGNAAYKVNLLSAVAGALTAVLVYYASGELGSTRAASWAAAIICSISPIFFTEALKAEAYTLNSLMVMAVFILGFKMIKGGDFFRLSLLSIFIVGLGMGNHHTIALAGLALIVPFGVRWREISLKWFILAMLFFLAGLSVNLLLYMRSLALDRPAEGLIYSYAGSLVDFIKVFLREDFGGSETSVIALTGNVSPWIYAVKNSLRYILFTSLRPVIVFPFLGLIMIIQKGQRRILTYLLLLLCIWLFLLARMVLTSPSPSVDHIQTVSVYFLPVIPVLYCLVALGFTLVIDFFKRMNWDLLSRSAPFVLVALPFVFLPYSIKDYRLDRTYIAYDSGRDMLQGLPVKSLLMNHTDNATFTTYYFRTVDRFREDLIEMSTGGKYNVFGLQTSPRWKYEDLFPEFYKARNSSLREMNAMFAYNGRLYVNNPLNRANVFRKNYAYYPGLLSAILIPKSLDKDTDTFIGKVNQNFVHALERANYERVIDTPYPYDYMAREIFAVYGFSLAVYSDLARQKGDVETAERFMTLSLKATEPQLFAWPYITFLLDQDRSDEAFEFINRLKAAENTKGIVSLLQNMTESAIEERHAKEILN